MATWYHHQGKQQIQKNRCDHQAKPRHFLPDASVFAHNFSQGDKWLPGIIIKAQGP